MFMASVEEKTVVGPDKAHDLIMGHAKRDCMKYREIHNRFLRESARKCTCDRATCARCLGVNGLMEQLKQLINPYR
jgi:hypothetical protein